MAESKQKEAPAAVGEWKWYRLSVVDENGRGFESDPETGDIANTGRYPFYAHAVAGHTFAFITEKVSRSTEGETVRVQQPGAIDRLWVTGNPEDCELIAIKSRMGRYVVRWTPSSKTAQVFEVGGKSYRPERGDVPIAKYLRMEEVHEPAVTALV